jgi:chorismate mutase/prephenate dehydratase
VENSTEGAVTHTLDGFMESELRICAQVLMRIENHLASRGTMSEIRRIYSHPQVFGQCRRWLQQHMPQAELIEVSSTPRAAELAALDPTTGALVGRMAAGAYQLEILQESVQDHPNNTTRFLVVGHTACPPTGDDRTSLMFCVKDEPGALFRILEPFYRHQLSLSKIESRPSKRKPWEYFFFMDVDGHADETNFRSTLEEVSAHCTYLKILGTYPRTQ